MVAQVSPIALIGANVGATLLALLFAVVSLFNGDIVGCGALLAVGGVALIVASIIYLQEIGR